MKRQTMMSRRELVDTAKQMILADGPSNCLEFTTELIVNYASGLSSDEDIALFAEMHVQAKRVYSYLGYDSPW